MSHGPRFVVCGEALFDIYAGEQASGGLHLDARAGGSPFNVAIGLSRLGHSVALASCISAGFLGQRLMKALQDEGVDTRLVQRSPAPATISLVGVDDSGGPCYEFYGGSGADLCLGEALLEQWPDTVACIHVGSYTTVMGPSAGVQRRLIERERNRCLISYDPNVRLAAQPDTAEWTGQIDWMLSRAHLVKASCEDLDLAGLHDSPQSFADRAIRAGVALVVVTDGARGATAWYRGQRLDLGAATVDVVDTVGAGDSFQAALLAALADQGCLSPQALHSITVDQLRAALECAGRAAAITCSRRAADLPRSAEIASAAF